ncbi:MAG: MBL fold metallo-hydrolase [Oscillospiraceae bacterium]|nr:MBL fold metallo-hydrolase [Oscillospiraceae bacterium]
MELQFIGATHGVTGSAHLLTACGKKILIDYGMRQGREEHVTYDLPLPVNELDAVLVTHAHVDHTGYLPLLAKGGYTGKIYSTGATFDLCKIMLMDSAHIQEQEAEWESRKNKRSGKGEVEPLYTQDDAQQTLRMFRTHEYLESFEIAEGVTATFYDVGHLLGSAAIEIKIDEKGVKKTVVFSGDVGNIDQPLIKDPQFIKYADYIVCESTYGDRLHDVVEDYRAELAQVIQETFDRGGNVVIPAFAVGRTQELLYFLRDIITKGMVKGHTVPVYIDSPMAIETVKVFDDNIYGYFDEEAMAVVKSGIDPINFPTLKTAVTSDESKLINFDKNPKVIISASGMCDAGRIRHHLKHNLWRSDSTIVFVGYQAEGTLGRRLLDGVKKVKLFNETIEVNARIIKLDGISGHADQKGLIRWLKGFENKPQKLFLVHGDRDVFPAFEEKITQELGWPVYSPYYTDKFNLATGQQTFTAPKTIYKKPDRQSASGVSRAYTLLLQALEKLTAAVKKRSGYPNGDLNNARRAIEDIIEKLER